MAKRYRYTFKEAGTYERADGTKVSVYTAGASVVGGYREFAPSKNIEVKPISTNKKS